MSDVLTRVRIGGLNYRAYTVRNLHTEAEDGYIERDNGRLFYDQLAIELAADLNPDLLPVAVWHEVLHALAYQAGLVEHDEAMVHALAYGIVQVMRDNPLLVAMTTQEGQGGG